MKNVAIFIVLIVITFAIVAPLTEGLECYICVSGEGTTHEPHYHKACKEGNLPNRIAENCTVANALDPDTRKPYNASFVEEMTKQGRWVGCTKTNGMVDGKEITLKACSYYTGYKQDICENRNLGDNVKGTGCVCHSDKCNTAVALSVNSIAFMSLISYALVFGDRF